MKLLDQLWPWLCSSATLFTLAYHGKSSWDMGDKEGASILWLSILPVGILLLVLIITGQAMERHYQESEENKQDQKQPDHASLPN